MIRLETGHYLSPVRARRAVASAGLVETVYAAGMRLPRHRHDFPYLVLMVEGTLRERTMGRTFDLGTGSVVFNEAGECHENEVLCGRARCLNVELRPRFMERLAAEGLAPRESVLYTQAGAALGAIGRLYAATIDPGPELEIEEALVELFEAAWGRAERNPGVRPSWLPRIVECLHEGPDCPSLSHLAAEAGVHHAHLCRGFRAAIGCTIGEYYRRLRAARALGAVTGEATPLISVALREGYSDQAHMTRELSGRFGRPPRRLRLAAAQTRFKTHDREVA